MQIYEKDSKLARIVPTKSFFTLFVPAFWLLRKELVTSPRKQFHPLKERIIMNIGDKIPEILGKDQDGKEIKASDYQGRKLVLYSYPKANTSGCTAEACSLQQHKAALEAEGYAIIGVSKDRAELQKKFADKNALTFPLIADTDTTLLQQLGCWGEKVTCGRHTVGILRTTYLVNEQGVVERIFQPKEIKTKIHAEQILDYIRTSK